MGVPLALMLHPRDHHDLTDLDDDLAAELRVLSTHLARCVEVLPHIRPSSHRLGRTPRRDDRTSRTSPTLRRG
ncbi:MAG: hypothetical protein ABIQ59_09270 [Nocardioidaceae bacterium]